MQELITNLAAGVLAAYNAFNDPSTPDVFNSAPSPTGYDNVQTIWVSELAELPVSGSEYQVFGFAASAADSTASHNILALRGTATAEESGYDLFGWDTTVPFIPPSSDDTTTSYGNVKNSLYNFYALGPLDFYDDSLASSLVAAVQAVEQVNPNKPWFVTAHSLGGAIATLGAFDAYLCGYFSSAPTLVTFGGLHVGDSDFVQAYMSNGLPQGIRFANQCDFVPSLVALEPGVVPSTGAYAALGQPATFVWQTWNDWGNHSLVDIYQQMIIGSDGNGNPYWNLLEFGGSQTYPQAG